MNSLLANCSTLRWVEPEGSRSHEGFLREEFLKLGSKELLNRLACLEGKALLVGGPKVNQLAGKIPIGYSGGTFLFEESDQAQPASSFNLNSFHAAESGLMLAGRHEWRHFHFADVATVLTTDPLDLEYLLSATFNAHRPREISIYHLED